MINLVYIQFGQNPSPTLLNSARNSDQNLINVRKILITDHPTRWAHFPGQIINVQPHEISSELALYTARFPEFYEIANGYWIFTLIRIFALRKIEELIDVNEPVIQIEADVTLFLNNEDLNQITSLILKTAIPRHSASQGIASVIVAPTFKQLLGDLDLLEQHLLKSTTWLTDMDLLGEGLNLGILEELPTKTFNGYPTSTSKLIFDGLALGQYIFGRDPLHTNGRAISGFISPELPSEILEMEMSIKRIGNQFAIGLTSQNEFVRFANLHVHAKYDLPSLNPLDPFWEKVIKEFNREIPRTPGPYREDLIHSIKPSIKSRYLLIKRRGVRKTIQNKIKRLRSSWQR